MWEWIVGGVAGALGVASGWIAAYLSRGTALDAQTAANAAADRARIAEAKTEAVQSELEATKASAATSAMQLKAADVTVSSLRIELQRSQADKGDLLEKLAKQGVPVGDDLFDSVTNRLHKAGTGRAPIAGDPPGPGGNQDGVSGVASTATPDPIKN